MSEVVQVFDNILPNVREMDITNPVVEPYVVVIAGQSHALGPDTGGSKTILSGIFTLDSITAPTAIEVAQFGSGMLRNGASCSLAAPGNCLNNIGVQFANALRLSGDIPATRPIIVIVNALNGISIDYWVGAGASSQYFAYLAAALNVVTTTYPLAKVDHLIWAQGEADGTAGAYNTKATYTTAFQTLLAQCRALPQWRTNTTVSMQELTTFADNNWQNRNDAIRSFADGGLDPFVTAVGSTGLTESVSNAPHMDGASVVIVGARHYAAYRKASFVSGRYDAGLKTKAGSALAFKDVFSVSVDTQLSHDDIRTGAAINHTGGVLTLPSPSFETNSPPLILNVTGNQTIASLSVGIMTPNGSGASLSIVIGGGTYFLYVAGGYWHLLSVDPLVGGFRSFASINSASATITLNAYQIRDAVQLCDGNTINLPALSTSINGSRIGFLGKPGGSSSTINSNGGLSNIVSPGGTLVSTYTLLAGRYAKLELIGGYWVVTTN